MEQNSILECNSKDLISFKNFAEICRVCLSEVKGTPIFDVFFKEKRVTEVLSLHLIIEVNSDDILPQNICNRCCEELLKMCSIIEKCQNSDVILHRYEEYFLKKEVGVYDELIKEEEISHDSENTTTKDADTEAVPECTNTKNINDLIIIEELDCTANQINVISNVNAVVSEMEVGEKETSKNNSSKIYKRHCPVNATTKPFKRKTKNVHKSQCPTCLQVFLTRTLVQHMRVHTKEKPYECRECFKAFSMNANLKRHMLLHTGERPHVCEICDKGFTQLAGLTKHKQTHISNKCITDTIARPSNYTCSFCGRKFKLLKAHDNHVRKHTNVENETVKNEDKVNKEPIDKMYECATCNKSYSKKSTLRTHQLSHGEKSFLCNICGKSFITKTGLEGHFTIHSGEKPHNCKFCNKSFARVVSLELHLLIHMGKKAHRCNICGKSFTQPNHLRYHMLTHTGEKPYDCSYCGKRFAMKGNLTVHVRTHTGETPYVCSVCNKGFYDSSSMKKHEKGHTKVTTS